MATTAKIDDPKRPQLLAVVLPLALLLMAVQPGRTTTSVNSADALFEAMQNGEDTIVVETHITKDESVTLVSEAPATLRASPHTQWLMPFNMVGEEHPGRGVPVETAFFPPVVSHSTRLVCGIPNQRCLLDGQDRGLRAFLVGAGGSLYLEGFHLRGWRATTGGAIRIHEGGTAELRNCSLESNSAVSGGASLGDIANNTVTAFGTQWGLHSAGGAVLIASGGSLVAEDVIFASNFAEDRPDPWVAEVEVEGAGGAVAVVGGGSQLNCRRCLFSGNSAGATGGAIAVLNAGAGAALQDSSVASNVAQLAGGGISLLEGAAAEMVDVSLTDNVVESTGGGGAIAITLGSVVLAKRSNLTSNAAMGGPGGAVALSASAKGFFDSVDMSENFAAEVGGALSLTSAASASMVGGRVSGCRSTHGGGAHVTGKSSLLQLTTSAVFVGNRALQKGGHVSVVSYGRVVADDIVFWDGVAPSGGALHVEDDGSAAGRDLQLFGNTAETGGGGAIHVLRQGTVSLEGGLAVGNTAVADVGGSVALASNGGQLLLAAGLQLSNNSFTTPGAVLSVDTGSYMLANDIVVETSAGSASGISPVRLSNGGRAVLSSAVFRLLANPTDLVALQGGDQIAPHVMLEDLKGRKPRVAAYGPGLVTIAYRSGAEYLPDSCAPLTCTLSDSRPTCGPEDFSPLEATAPTMLGDEFSCWPALHWPLDAKEMRILPQGRTACDPGAPQPQPLCGGTGELVSICPAASSDPGCTVSTPPPEALPNPPPPPPPPPPPQSPPPPPSSPNEDGGLSPETITDPEGPSATLPPPTDPSNGGDKPEEGGWEETDDGYQTQEEASPPPGPDPPSTILGMSGPALIVLVAFVALLLMAVTLVAGIVMWRHNSRRGSARGQGTPEAARRKGGGAELEHTPMSQAALVTNMSWDYSSPSPYSTGVTAKPSPVSTRPPGASQKPPSAPPPPSALSSWCACYQFFPCGKVDMLYGDATDTDSPTGQGGLGGGSTPLARVQAPGKPGVFIPPRPPGELKRHPALPHLAPKHWGRADVHMTLPASLRDLDGLREPSSAQQSQSSYGSSIGSGASSSSRLFRGPRSSLVSQRRPSCPDITELEHSLQREQPGDRCDKSALPVDVAPHRTLTPQRSQTGTRRSTTAAAAAAAEQKRGSSALNGIVSDFSKSGLVEVDFETEIKPNLQGKLGSGAYGDVYLANWQGKQVAVKIFNRGFAGATSEQADSFRQEVLMMMRLGSGCRQIVSIYGACFKQPHMALIYQYIPGGSLYKRIHGKDQRPLTYLEVLKLGHDLASGLSFLHPNVVHRDLKPMNILLDGDGTAMLIDFGVSRERDPRHSYFNTKAGGTPAYMAPEMFNGDRFSEKVDVYALACILWECVSREMLWGGETNFGVIVYSVSINEDRPRIPASCPEPLARLIARCWHTDARLRPSCYEISMKLQGMIDREEARLAEGLQAARPSVQEQQQQPTAQTAATAAVSQTPSDQPSSSHIHSSTFLPLPPSLPRQGSTPTSPAPQLQARPPALYATPPKMRSQRPPSQLQPAHRGPPAPGNPDSLRRAVSEQPLSPQMSMGSAWDMVKRAQSVHDEQGGTSPSGQRPSARR